MNEWTEWQIEVKYGSFCKLKLFTRKAVDESNNKANTKLENKDTKVFWQSSCLAFLILKTGLWWKTIQFVTSLSEKLPLFI